MTIKENELMEIPYTASFMEMFTITDDLNLLLNGIEVYGCTNITTGRVVDRPINFDIRVIKGKKVIYPLECADSFLLHAKRLVKATAIEIKASDYCTHMSDIKSPKREDNIEEDLQNYICDLCDTKNIPIDIRFACFGDENMFYEKENGGFQIRCEHYHVNDISEVKKLIANTYLVRLWQQAKPYHMIALYIRDIVNTGNGYNVIVGGRLFKNSK